MKTETQKWIDKSNKKKAKLYKSQDGKYTIIFFFKNKVRIGQVKDGMHHRYGIATKGAMYSSDILSLWQSGPGSCNTEEVKAMQDYINGESKLPDFDFATLKDIQY